ncbi:hypothetical protein A3D42_00320 [Candidatus Nomurabacteria bacterium RIFCSPHIGHO2_02_FULL_41_18]|uniref:Uncharacterized protein n=1 Tax=Candidatus Nomurabacteria bacterium RIFCSPHIGHO2_02_FULL_41_18 TaxID=1801754 RepID=A0A1F6W841_9BACT|nr:MAG: hypothetical protein A2737_02400 [Candidatus Nomurabacteria bacterium RIFCSPHIGHO2_01_FULL_41_71]OGI77946.1 MAG: hypothetical protein A3D42_00320 [Candidatus Nomurabacteria bacterium RIFCSPHIGHO2_02_FULL_41_18]OGI89562.1 MAG: hypothetical protein A3B01_00215 [Candidatus Nomurabacteria bacterium RIFCSPLOWO2_01_FULL_41_52b]OGJ00429.1 MAG: hypothetical protein A3I90_01670 [Candidatus Nomurabacteria bacterium RIFCSPLOWO2_02_FULL_41_9]
MPKQGFGNLVKKTNKYASKVEDFEALLGDWNQSPDLYRGPETLCLARVKNGAKRPFAGPCTPAPPAPRYFRY